MVEKRRSAPGPLGLTRPDHVDVRLRGRDVEGAGRQGDRWCSDQPDCSRIFQPEPSTPSTASTCSRRSSEMKPLCRCSKEFWDDPTRAPNGQEDVSPLLPYQTPLMRLAACDRSSSGASLALSAPAAKRKGCSQGTRLQGA